MCLSWLFRTFLMASIVNEIAPKFAGTFVTHINLSKTKLLSHIFKPYFKAIEHASHLLHVFFLVVVNIFFIWRQQKSCMSVESMP